MSAGLKAFISYSHVDEHSLERLSKHLSMLKREGTLIQWFDQRILPGGDIDEEISLRLKECELFIPLVSADFLASNYCYERELTQALERHAQGSIRVLPVIIQDCDWKSSPLGKLKALPKDGKPVADWTNENNAWVDVVSQIRRIIEEAAAGGGDGAQPETAAVGKRSPTPKYRVKRDFDEVDRANFREEAYREIRNYFSRAASEIAEVADIKSRYSDMDKTGFTCTVVNRARDRGVAHITVYANGRRAIGDITYSLQERAEPNTANGWFQIEADDYDLFLRPGSMARSDDNLKLSPTQVAERLWEELLEQAGIAYE